MNLEQMDYEDLEPVMVSVTLGKGDRKVNYLLREATAAAAVKYKNKQAAAMKFSGSGELQSVGDVGDADLLLVSMCLCETVQGKPTELKIDKNGNACTVPVNTISRWKTSVYNALAERIKEISPGLEDTPTEEGILKQMAVLQRHLDKIRKAKEVPADEATKKESVPIGDSSD